MNQLKIALILACHNRKEKTIDCLLRVKESKVNESVSVHVFLTDDGSTDGTSEAVRCLGLNLTIVQGDGSLFWNRGMLLAWKAAVESGSFDYFLWLNDDTAIYRECIDVLLTSAFSFSNTAIIVGTTIGQNAQSSYTYGGRTMRNELIVPSASAQICAYFNGNIVLIPNKVFQIVGFNDYKFVHGVGDYDYGRKAAAMGIKSYVAPNVLGECDEHDSLSKWCNPDFPFTVRWKNLRSPLGQNPEEFFLYDYRYNGLFMAVYHYLTIHLRVFFPKVWLLKN